MINTNNVGGESYKDFNQLPEAGLINKTLPLEIFTRVLSYLDGMDVKQASLVSRLWSETAIDSPKREEFALIKKYAQEIAERLIEEPYAEQKKALQAIVGDTKILDSVNLIEVQSSVGSLKETIVNILKGLPGKKLDDLEDIPKPPFFENILNLAKLYRRVDEFFEMPHQNRQESRNIIKELINLGYVSKALDFAVATVPQLNAVRYLFSIISLEQADNFLLKLPDNIKDEAYYGISHGFSEKKRFDTAEDYAKLIKDKDKKIILLQAIYTYLIQIKCFNRIEETLSLVDEMPEVERGRFCVNMAHKLMRSGHTESARKFARLIPDERLKEDILWDCTSIEYDRDQGL